MPSSQIVIEEFHSLALENNPLKDPVTRKVPVYLPPEYDDQKKYPSIFLLTGFAARGLKLLNDDLWQENIQQRLDRLILNGDIQPVIVVMPDASTRLGGSQYMNSAATGNYEDHILELVQYIDNTYPTRQGKNYRAVMGHSSGGYGALRLSMRQPRVFGLTAAHAPDLYFEMVYQKDFPQFLQFFDRAGAEGLQHMLDNPGDALSKGVSFYALAFAAMASCYSPNPDSPWGFDLPFDTYTGELNPEVWARWQENDPIHMAARHADSLRSLKLLYIDCGIYDEENLLYGTRILAKQFNELHIPHTYEQFEGGHRNTQFRYDVSLKAISKSFGQADGLGGGA
ncbi:MAG TPA: alpha/beta hydrolase-fold protein [Anaerolineales bacterium]|jgi:enterochelin esterase family protein|nr:alpha/beta hydrolase-fold protein [Anaerolineales bacterium]